MITGSQFVSACDIFVLNVAKKSGGGLHLAQIVYTQIFSCFSYGQISKGSGGHIWTEGSKLQFTNSVCKANSAEHKGGTIFATKSKHIGTTNCMFASSVSKSSKGAGGAIFITLSKVFTSRNCKFVSNQATLGNGGTISVESVTFTDLFACSFINNSAGLNGGAVNSKDVQYLTIIMSVFSDQISNGSGGALHTFVTVGFQIYLVYLQKTVFKFNTAILIGSAVHSEFIDNIALLEAEFVSNVAGDKGGAIMIIFEPSKKSVLVLHKCQFVKNSGWCSDMLNTQYLSQF